MSSEETTTEEQHREAITNPWRRRIIAAGVCAALVAAFMIGSATGSSTSDDAGEDTEQVHDHGEDDGEDGEDGEDVEYICPMHPQVRQSEPGTCPICHMDLVVAEKGENGGSDIPSISLSEGAKRLARVRTEVIEPVPLTRTIDAFGRVGVAESGEVDLTAWVGGRIEQLRVNTVGERVRRGQLLARVYSPDLLSAQQSLLQASRNLENAREGSGQTRARAAEAGINAARTELRLLGMSSGQIDSILEQGKAKEIVSIHANASGTVRRRHVSEGDWVETGGRILSLAGLDTVWIQLELYERDLPFVREGMSVDVEVPALGGETIEGRIDFLDPVLDEQRRVARARVVATNEEGQLRPGMYVRATIESPLEADEPQVSVPESAILWTGPRSLVYQHKEGIGYVPVEVDLGPKVGQRRVIRQGLDKGDEVVVQGAFRIDASLQIQGGPAMMGSAAPTHDHGGGGGGGGGGEHAGHAEDLPEVEVAADGTEFDPPIQPEQLPDDVWYCDMGTTHYARGDEGDGRCEVCGMHLKHHEGDGDSDHDHGDDEETR